MTAQKQHIVANIDSVHLNNQVLVVIEYTGDNIMPSNVFMISQFDEIEETVSMDFSKFPKLESDKVFDDAFDQHLHTVKQMQEIYCGGQEIPTVHIACDDVTNHLNEKYEDKVFCIEDFENIQYLEFILDKFHVDFVNEQHLRFQANRVGFLGKITLDNYLEDRMKRRGF